MGINRLVRWKEGNLVYDYTNEFILLLQLIAIITLVIINEIKDNKIDELKRKLNYILDGEE